MKLVEMLSPETIQVDLTAPDKWSAIETLVDFLIERNPDIDHSERDEILKSVTERERSMSTGMEHSVAIPHGATHCVSRVHAVLGISKEGIPFESFDGSKAHIVVLFVIPKNQFQQHIRTLAGIARLLNNGLLRDRIRNSTTPADVCAVIQAFENPT